MPYPHSLQHDLAEAGLPGSFRWQGVKETEEPGHVQVLEQAQSSRWSLSTAGTPLQGIFPPELPKSLFRSRSTNSVSDLRAKTFYEEPQAGRKKTLLTKSRPEDLQRAYHPLTVTIGVKHEGTDSNTAHLISPYSRGPIRIISDSPKPAVSPVGSGKAHKRWLQRKNSLGKIVQYPSKILGKILPKRDSPKESAPPPLPVTESWPSRPVESLRRAETTVRRPKRSSDLERPEEPSKRWSIASTQAIRAERFSNSVDQPRMDRKKPEDSTLLLSTSNQSPHSSPQSHTFITPTRIHPHQLSPSPPSHLKRSLTQLDSATESPSSDKKLERNYAERRRPIRSIYSLGQGLAGKPHLPRTLTSEANTMDTVSSIARRIAARELDVNQHDSWDFLDYYAQRERGG
ncbi:hypothetical protein D9757_012729 [Collybiopsis confluens]|uniref:Uncharacterized protein n=1 Tax=Collybiopsis confluens TaxID=2823264 RepID=A0A8H5D4D5_9AGAR|nr:hypothetical protein D9757_012729 [Collybiopsis confluens]